MIAYERGLQYWAEKFSLPSSADLHPLVGSIVELREAMQEHVTFSHRDVVLGLTVIHLESMSQWPQTTLFNCVLGPPVEGQHFAEATTSTTLSTAAEDMTECITPSPGIGEEN